MNNINISSNIKDIRNKKNRIKMSLLAAAFAAILATSVPDISGKQGVLAWWGTLYPEFCYVELEKPSEAEESGNDCGRTQVKISFWLAKALNW